MVSNGIGHPNIAAQFMVPFMVLTVLRFREPGRAVRNGLVLAALVVYQFFINAEILLFTALAIGVFIAVHCAVRRSDVLPYARSALVSLGVTTAVAGALLAFPLYWLFAGPMSYSSIPNVSTYGTDLLAFGAYSTESLAGGEATAEGKALNPAEESTFFGWSLLLLVALIVVWLWRRPVVWSLAATGVVFAALSLGTVLTVGGRQTGVPGPWLLFHKAPLLHNVVPGRLAQVSIPVIGLLLALAIERAGEYAVRAGQRWPVPRLLAAGVVATALLPIAPTAHDAVGRGGLVAEIFTSQRWRQQLPADAVVWRVPTTWDGYIQALTWATATNLEVSMVGGYYIAPAVDLGTKVGPPAPHPACFVGGGS
jgi:hypothetical protein